MRDRQNGWDSTDGYVRRFAGEHAVAAGRLDELVEDPGFLTVAFPEGVVPHLGEVVSEQARQMGQVFVQRARLLPRPRVEAAAVLEAAALMQGWKSTGDRLGAEAGESTLRLRWAHTRPETPQIVVIGTPTGIASVAVFETSDGVRVVSGGWDGSIRLWDACRVSRLLRQVKVWF